MHNRINDPYATPPGGWKFTDHNKGRIFSAPALFYLVEKVSAYRRANGFDLGDPQLEIEEQLCSRFPTKCGKREAPPLSHNPQLSLNSAISYLKSFKERILHGPAPQEVAEVRAKICVSCPYNYKLPFCHTCGGITSIAGQLYTAIGSLKTSYDSSLNECGVCGCSLKARVHEPVNSPLGQGEYPVWCWRRKEAEGQLI